MASGLTGTQVAARLLISQPKVSHMETGRRAVSPRDVRDLCKLYGVTDPRGVARRAGRAGGTPTATFLTASTSTWRRKPPPSIPTSPW
ncbi:helix-turn-helix domain-containing protein [Streptomyces sp. NPDC059442]|uniref:helix-turn-helix domain-containing protein n=1 Tax=Streptomyces sp. NPDC059442 TaxID=3346830 RepID=UPI003682975C